MTTAPRNKIYLGDSVYAEVVDGMIKLTTESGYPYDDPSNAIYLENAVFEALLNYAREIGWLR